VGTLLLSALREVIARDAIALPLPFDGATADLAALFMFDERLARADVVCLGEMNHFIHEKSDFRLFFARWLAARGWTAFAEELGWSDGARVSRYLASGDEAVFARLPSFNYTGHLRTDRDDLPRGVLKASREHYPVAAFVAEQSRFYRGLRGAGGMRFFGIDIDGAPGGSYEDIRAWLAPFAVDPAVARFLQALARVPGEDALQEAQRLRVIDASLLAGAVGEAVARDVRFSLDALIDSLNYIVLAYSAPRYDALRPAMAFRENAMKRRFTAAQALGGDKLVLMGHALHLAKQGDPVGASGVGPGGGQVSSLGVHLAQERGLKLFSVWMLYGAGRDSQPFPDLPRGAHYAPDTLNAILAERALPLLLPLSDPIFQTPVKIGHMYNATVSVAPQQQADAIFFLPEVSPLRA
jgi:erythromycin esterase-like protein